MLVLKINTSHKSIAYYNRKSTTSSSSSIHSLVLVPVDQCVRRSWSSILTAFWDADSRDAAFTLYGSDFTLGSSSMSNSISPPLPFAAGWGGWKANRFGCGKEEPFGLVLECEAARRGRAVRRRRGVDFAGCPVGKTEVDQIASALVFAARIEIVRRTGPGPPSFVHNQG